MNSRHAHSKQVPGEYTCSLLLPNISCTIIEPNQPVYTGYAVTTSHSSPKCLHKVSPTFILFQNTTYFDYNRPGKQF